MNYAKEVHQSGDWVLSWTLRSALYSRLFIRMVPNLFWVDWNTEVIRSNLKFLKQLQGFLLEASTSIAVKYSVGIEGCPSLESFVIDAIVLLEILQTPNPSSRYDVNHPFSQLHQRRFSSWETRWGLNNLKLPLQNQSVRLEWEHYMCGLCDALFGIWPAPGPHMFHTSRPDAEPALNDGLTRDCIRSLVSFYTVSSTTSLLSEILDYRVFDASFIESCGPFRFQATDRLAAHLTITHDQKILYYNNWKKWSFLTWHKVLNQANKHNTEGRHVGFDTLTNLSRVRNNYSLALIKISADILNTNIICFHQRTLNSCQRAPTPKCFSWSILRRSAMHSKLSSDIGRRIGLDMTETETKEYARTFISTFSEDWGNLLDKSLPFQERKIKLYKTLKEWKPKTVWEMRYAGYGGVDPVGLYAFYFASLLGIITIIGLGVTAAQTYSGFCSKGNRNATYIRHAAI